MMRRLERSRMWSRWMKGTTNTPPPMITFWALKSVEICPVSGLVTAFPFWPVMM